jgi:predicted N-acetyltransferase YhbS
MVTTDFFIPGALRAPGRHSRWVLECPFDSSVLPECQKQNIGKALVLEGLSLRKDSGGGAVSPSFFCKC